LIGVELFEGSGEKLVEDFGVIRTGTGKRGTKVVEFTASTKKDGIDRIFSGESHAK
jgi:hypothetical protein